MTAPEQKKSQYFEILLLITLPIIVCLLWYVWGGNEAWDDAFISFRYSQNLAWGRGLVWNLGGEPTQGYTNFLFVILIAGGIKLGLFPVLSAFILNTSGVVAVVVSFWQLSKYLLPTQPVLRLIPPLAIAIFPLTLLNVLTGLETVFWSGLVFTTAAWVLLYIKTERRSYLIGVVISAFLASLTRPEGVIFDGLWFLILLVQSQQRRAVLLAIGIFGVLGLIYTIWLKLYFGDILPNPFYVKVIDAPGLFPGSRYVAGFLAYFSAQVFFYPGFIGLIRAINRSLFNIIPYAVVLALFVFYLFTTPLMGEHFRFLYPVTCLFVFMIALGSVHVIIWLGEWMTRRSLPFTVRVFSQFLIGLVCLNVFFIPTLLETQSRVSKGLSSTLPPHNLPKTALALAAVPGIHEATIAYGDAGMMAYYTDSQFLDVVGLNNNKIAREAPKEGPEWVINTVLEQNPDLISFYSNYDQTIYNRGHGVIGASYSNLYQRPDFQDNYDYAGGFDYIGFYAHWFVRKDSPLHQEVIETLHKIADVTEYTFIP